MLPVLVAIVTYNRVELTMQCIESLLDTTTPQEIEIGIFDNNSVDGTAEYLAHLNELKDPRIKFFYSASENIGTARAINTIWRHRKKAQAAIKLDNDVTFQQNGWVTRMTSILEDLPIIGQLGIKRHDLLERAYHPYEHTKTENAHRSQLFELVSTEIVEIVNHVLGTCVMFSPLALEQMGDLYQMQDEGNVYGFDDSLASLRLRLLGFQCAFARGTFSSPIRLLHIDRGGDAYTQLKRDSAGEWIPRYLEVCKEFESGQRESYWRDSSVK